MMVNTNVIPLVMMTKDPVPCTDDECNPYVFWLDGSPLDFSAQLGWMGFTMIVTSSQHSARCFYLPGFKTIKPMSCNNAAQRVFCKFDCSKSK